METVSYTYCPPGEGSRQTRLKKQINIPVVSNGNRLQEMQEIVPDPIVAFFGYGHNLRSTRRTLDWLATQRIHAVSPVLPLRELPCGRHVLVQACGEMPGVVVDFAKTKTDATKLSGFGHSQGGAVVSRAVDYNPDVLGDLSLLASAGQRLVDFDHQALQPGELVARFLRNGREQSLSELETWIAASGISRELALDLVKRRFGEKVQALDIDLPRAIVRHAAQNRVGLFFGRNDPVFPPEEGRAAIQAALQATPDGEKNAANIIFEIIPGAHDSPNSRSGRAQVLQAFSFLPQYQIFATT